MRGIVFTILMTLILSGCEYEGVTFEGPYHVRFTEESSTELESYTDPISIQVHLAGPQRKEPIIIRYGVSGDAIEGKDYEILGNRGELRIPPNESFANINLQLINNSNNILSSQDIVFTLESVEPNDLHVGFGDISPIGKEYVFTIYDDCILGGTYTGQETGNSEFYQGIRITSSDCITYRLSNWDLGLDIFQFSSERDLTFRDNGDNTLTIPEQEEETIVPEQATIRGSGYVSPINGEITLQVEFVDVEGNPTFELKYNRQ